MKVELEKQEQHNGEHLYVVFVGTNCKGIFTEKGEDALKDIEGISLAQRKAESLYKEIVDFYKSEKRTKTLLSIEI